MNMIRSVLFFPLLLGVSLPGYAARVYQSTGPGGVPQFSDQPSPQAREIDIHVPATDNPTAPPKADDKPAPGSKTAPEKVRYTTLAITQPANDAVHWFSEGPLQVLVDIVPPLAEGHVLVPLLDGVAQGEGVASNGFALNGLNPGTYELSVAIRDADGRDLKQSTPVRFHYKHHTVNLPARRPAPAGGN